MKSFKSYIRSRIAVVCELVSPLKGEVEIDESYFRGRRVKGKRGRGVGGKIIVFGIFNRMEKYIQRLSLMPVGKHSKISYWTG